MSADRSIRVFVYLTINACLGTFLLGYYLTCFNPLQTTIQYLLYQNDSSSMQVVYESVLTAAIPLGGAMGSSLSSVIFLYFGRKKSFFFCDFFCIVGALITLIESIPSLIIGRLICGFCMGINSSLVGIYIKEICPTDLLEYFGSFVNISLNSGILFSFLLGLNALSDDELAMGESNDWWRFMFAIPIIFCLLRSLIIFFMFNFEPPIYLLINNRNDEALLVLKKLYTEENIREINHNLVEKAYKIKEAKLQNDFSLKKSFLKKYGLKFSVAFMMIFANQWSGVNALFYYSSKVFKKNGFSSEVTNILNGGYGVINLLSGFLIVIPLKYLKIHKTFLFSLLFCSISLGLIALTSYLNESIGSIICIYFFDFFFNLGNGPIIFILIPEMLPDFLVGISFLFFWIHAFIIGLCFSMMIESDLGVSGSFTLFCICVLVAYIYCYFFFKKENEEKNIEKKSLVK